MSEVHGFTKNQIIHTVSREIDFVPFFISIYYQIYIYHWVQRKETSIVFPQKANLIAELAWT